MKQVIDLISDPRMKEEFERYYKATSAEERQAIIEESKRRFDSLSDEEKTTETARQFESVRAVIDGVKANNEELAARRIREKLGIVPEAISMSYVAKNYFGKTKTWLYQRLNGLALSAPERQQGQRQGSPLLRGRSPPAARSPSRPRPASVFHHPYLINGAVLLSHHNNRRVVPMLQLSCNHFLAILDIDTLAWW